jgi:serine/threonine protein phosphatase PrpC
MAETTAFSARNIAGRDRLEDYAVDANVSTASGLNLQVIMSCDGAGGGEVGELAARLTARTILGYLEISTETDVPKLLVKAIEEANRIVFGELHGTGTSTVALAALHQVDDSSPGQMYVASVGDSRIYLLRDGRIARLNIDHTLANEYVYAGQMTAEEAARLENADYATRVIGVSPVVQVDIGFYAERGKSFVNSRRAFRIGQQGMALKNGDTVFVASDGMFKLNSEDGQPFLNEDELLRHALDDDVERAGRSLMRYAATRHPGDNISLSMFFVPSRDRKAVRIGIGLSRRQKLAGSFMFLLLVSLTFVALIDRQQAGEESEGIRETQTAQQVVLDAQGGTITVLSYTDTPTATATASPTPTATPLPTATFEFEDQVGRQFFPTDSPHGDRPVRVLVANSLPDPLEISQMNIAGTGRRQVAVPANEYLQPKTIVQFLEIDTAPNQEQIEMLLYPEGDIFVLPGDFINLGVEILLAQDERIVFDTQVECLAARQMTPDPNIEDDHQKVAFSCYTAGPAPREDNCQYRFARGEEVAIPIGYRVLLDVEDRVAIGTPGPILYEEAQRYYETIERLSPDGVDEDARRCFRDYLDGDDDGFADFEDFCPDDASSPSAFGCPDADADGFPDRVDIASDAIVVDGCPDIAGSDEYGGCVATATPTETPLFTNTPDVTGTSSPTPTITPSPFPAVCGDGFVNAMVGEQCDPPDGGVSCSDDCRIINVVCGDGRCDVEEGAASCPVDCDSDGDGVANDVDACPDDPNDTFGDPCDHDEDGDGLDDDDDACPDYFNDAIGDPCAPNDCPDLSAEDAVGDPCNHNDCADLTAQDAVGDPCVHDDCPDLSAQDAVGDPCVHDDCPDLSAEDAVGDPCDHNDCPDLSPQDGIGDSCDHDEDNDGVEDWDDNCPFNSNSGQQNTDSGASAHPDAASDSLGDACDDDDDGDGVLDNNDNCTLHYNPGQGDFDGDLLGNPCDPDDDGDGVNDWIIPDDPTSGADDNCRLVDNPLQVDSDGDDIGDACDDDNDNDGVVDGDDDCPLEYGTATEPSGRVGCPDSDGDGWADSDDNCPSASNSGQENNDGDADGDVCDPDDDNDGVNDWNSANDPLSGALDNCRLVSNSGQEDNDIADGADGGDACDADDDNDGIWDGSDACPFDAYHDSYNDPCNHDEDGDGVPDDSDACPSDPNDSYNDPCDHDEDGDGVLDEVDACPSDPNDSYNDPCDHDEDGDGIDDETDVCPADAVHDTVGDPCNHDEDGDGVSDFDDACPLVPGPDTGPPATRGCPATPTPAP